MSDLISYATMLEDNRLRDARIAALESPASSPVPDILFSCHGCWNGSATIPAASRGVYSRYEIFGQTGCWTQYCSSASFQFAASQAGSTADTQAAYCCVQAACGSVGQFKCYSSTFVYGCAGLIPWVFGCDSGCSTACSTTGFMYHASLIPRNICCTNGPDTACFQYCFSTTTQGGDGQNCCYGVRNRGYATNCCCASAACLMGVCFSTQSGTNAFNAPTSVIVVGYGKITPS